MIKNKKINVRKLLEDECPGQLLSREVLARLAKELDPVRRLTPEPVTDQEIAECILWCPVCKITEAELRRDGNIWVVDGYFQCAICRADIDYVCEPRELTEEDFAEIARQISDSLK